MRITMHMSRNAAAVIITRIMNRSTNVSAVIIMSTMNMGMHAAAATIMNILKNTVMNITMSMEMGNPKFCCWARLCC